MSWGSRTIRIGWMCRKGRTPPTNQKKEIMILMLSQRKTIALRWKSLRKTIPQSRLWSKTRGQISSWYLFIVLSWSTFHQTLIIDSPLRRFNFLPPSNLKFLLEPKQTPRNPTLHNYHPRKIQNQYSMKLPIFWDMNPGPTPPWA